MTPAGLLRRLRALDYTVALDGDRLTYRYTGRGDPPAGAAALLHQLAAHREAVVALLQRLERHPHRCPRCGGPTLPWFTEHGRRWGCAWCPWLEGGRR